MTRLREIAILQVLENRVKKMENSPNFSLEESFAKLENIAAQMESQTVGLDHSIALFEEGQALIRHCEELLSAAHTKIAQTQNEQE